MRALRPYLVGVALVAFFSVVKLAFVPLGRDVPFVLYFAAPLVAALTGGRWPGLFTAVLATFAANRFFLGHGNFDAGGAALLQSGAFLVEAGLVALVCDAFIHARSRLLAEREAQLRGEIHSRARSERLYRLTTGLASTMTARAVANRICEMAGETVGSHTTSLYVIDDAEQALVLESKRGNRRELDGYERIPVDAPVPIAGAVRDRRPRFFGSREAVAAEAPAIGEALASTPFQSWALLPLTGGAGRAIGVVTFVFRQGREFSDDDRQLMTAVAEQCGVALDRARAYEAEAAALRKKDEFLAVLGHELRNPLAPILTATKLIRMKGSASERELGVLERQAKHLVRLVDDLFDVSRITSGKLALRQVPVEIADVIAQAVESTGKPFEDKRLHLRTSAQGSGLAVNGDRERLVQVIANLLVNAAKFTPPERTVAVTATSCDGEVVIEVTDEGEGIAPDLLPHVFDLFTQGRQSSDRSAGGLGLGLAIARSIVAGHKGTIVAKSPGRNQGTTITVKLPLLEARLKLDAPEGLPARGEDAARKPARRRRRVLIVDDNADGAEMLATLFDQLGYETFIAGDAPEALRVAGENLPDAAVLDIGLPGMDGYELAAEFRARFGAKTPILVALTGYTQASDRERALDSGFHAHFGKPVNLESLATTFEQLFASHHEERRSELSPTQA